MDGGELIKVGTDPDCGCPEEVWLFWPFETTIHFEPDGSGHIFGDCGEFTIETIINDVVDMTDLKKKAEQFVYDWLNENCS